MSYATMPTFESNFIGRRPLRTLSGGYFTLRGMGDAAGDALAQQIVAAGLVDAGTVQTLIMMGATDNDLANLLNGTTDAGALMNQLTPAAGSTIPGSFGVSSLTPVAPGSAGTAANTGINPTVSPTAPAATAAAAAIAQSPAGSTVQYTATWNPSLNPLTSNFYQSDASVIASMTAALPGKGMQVVSSGSYGGTMSYGIQLTIKDLVGHQNLTDITSVCNSLLQGLVGTNLTSGATVLVAGPGQALPNTTNITAWLENNAVYIGMGIAAILFGSIVLKKI